MICCRPLAVALAVLCLPALLEAAPPKAVILGPTRVKPGARVVLDGSLSVGDHFRWKLPAALGDPDDFVCGDGKKCALPSYPGTYRVIFVVSNDEGNDLLEWTVVSDPSDPYTPPGPVPPAPVPPSPPEPVPPGPGPTPPGPIPNPEPVFPPGRFGLSADVYRWAMAVPSPQRGAESLALAAAAETVAADLDKSTSQDPLEYGQAALDGLTDAINVSTGKNAAAWKPFRKEFSGRIELVYRAGKLKTPQDWAELIREGVAGLKAVK